MKYKLDVKRMMEAYELSEVKMFNGEPVHIFVPKDKELIRKAEEAARKCYALSQGK